VTKSYSHTLGLHRLTSNSSSTANLPWLYPTDNSVVLLQFSFSYSLLHSLYSSVLLQLNTQLNSTNELNSHLIFASHYIDLGRTSRKTRVMCQNACSLAPLASTEHCADHIENTPSVVRMPVYRPAA
jgi:hypothetical protein